MGLDTGPEILQKTRHATSDYPPCNDPEYERTEFSEKVERRELYLQGGWLA